MRLHCAAARTPCPLSCSCTPNASLLSSPCCLPLPRSPAGHPSKPVFLLAKAEPGRAAAGRTNAAFFSFTLAQRLRELLFVEAPTRRNSICNGLSQRRFAPTRKPVQRCWTTAIASDCDSNRNRRTGPTLLFAANPKPVPAAQANSYDCG